MLVDNVSSAIAYYEAMNAKDLNAMGRYLHPQVEYTGPLTEVSGKTAVIEAVRMLIPFFKTVKIRNSLAQGQQVMMIYDIEAFPPIGKLSVASLLNFEEGKISRIELFYDARPFDSQNVGLCGT